MNTHFKLAVRPTWYAIEDARNESTAFLTSLGLSTEHVQASTMVVSELIENAVKYGAFSSPEDTAAVAIQRNGNIITIEVKSPLGADDEAAYRHLKVLDTIIQRIRGFQDPFEAYVQKLREVSRKPLTDEESGLGLVRIAYEGGAILDFFLGEDGNLNVSAILNC